MPGPSSSTTSVTESVVVSDTRTAVSACRVALSSRLRTTRVSCSRLPRTRPAERRSLDTEWPRRFARYVLGPDLGEFGQVVVPTGILRIESLSSGQGAVARIIRQFEEIKLEQRVIPAPGVSVPTGNLSQVIGGMRGKVVYVHDEPVLPSIGHYVLISPSAKNGVNVGDEVTFIDNSTGREESDPAPPVVAGVGQIVRVTPYAATAIIIRQTQPTIRDGMPIRLTGKMP